MASATKWTCDTCGRETSEADLLKMHELKADFCQRCVKAIVRLCWRAQSVGSKPLRPFCEACGGAGRTEKDEWNGHDRSPVWVDCQECKL